MRLRTLHLKAFGPFTDRVLEFQDQATLHVIYGPNESGKTSSLRALKNMLFGFPTRTNDNFLHPNPQLQVGGTFLTNSGIEKQFVRWKRNKNSLTDSEGDPVAESELVSLLGGLKSEMFDRLHGLSHRHLVTGGKALIKVGGRVGESLFAASLGPEFQDLAGKLKDEYEALWAGRVNAKRPLNECVRRWEEAEQQVARLALTAEAWSEVHEAFERAKTNSEKLKEQLTELTSELESNQRILTAAVEVLRREELTVELAELANVPELPEEFGSKRLALQTDVEISRKQLQTALGELEGVEAELKALPSESPLLEFSERVEALFKRVGVITEHTLEMPKVESELQQASQRIDFLLSNLAISQDGARPELPPQSWRIQARRLAQEHTTLNSQLKEKHSRRENLQEKLQQMPEASFAAVEQQLNQFQQAQQVARQEAGLDDVIVTLMSDIRTSQSSLSLDLERLPSWSGDLEELKRARVPSSSTLEDFERKLSAVARELESRAEELTKAEKRQREIVAQLETLSSGRTLYTLDDLHQARNSRREIWHELHHSWTLGDSPQEAGQLVEDFEKATILADDMADELMAAGERLAQFEQLRRELSENQNLVEELTKGLQLLDSKREDIKTDWSELWSGTSVLVESPRQMLSWLASREEILKGSARIQHRKKELASAQERLVGEVVRLGQVLETEFSSEKGLNSALVVVDQRVEQLRVRLQEQRSKLERKREAEQQLRDLEKDLVGLEKESKEWDVAWAGLLTSSPFSDVRPEMLEELLSSVESLAAEYERESLLSQRSQRLLAELGAFEKEVEKLTRQLEADSSEDEIRQVESAHRALKEALKVEENRRRLLEERDRKKHSTGELSKMLESQETALALHLQVAGTEVVSEVVELEAKAAHRHQLRQELTLLQSSLRRQSAGVPLDKFCLEVVEADLTELPQRQAEIADKRETLEEQREHQLQRAGQLEQKLATLDGTSRSAELKQQAAEAEAEARDLLDRYVQLSLAERLLSDQIEEYRKKNEGPILELASKYFGELTSGAYTQVQTGLDRRTAELVLMAVSESGREVAVEGLSDGTCDQLFLALRMAAIAGSGSNLPIIADDVLVQFDDRRANSALKALVEFSGLTQVILFTHLERDFRLAQELGDERVDLIEIPALAL